MARPLSVALLNVYAGNKTPRRAVRALLKSGPDSAGINEGYRIIPLLKLRRRYRVFHGEGGREPRGFLDTPILTRRELPSLGTMALRISERAAPLKLAPDRWVTVSCFDHPVGQVAHVNLHPNAAVMGRQEEVPRVREYAESMDTLDRLLGFLEEEGFLCVVTGDLNFRPEPRARRAPHSPYEVFARHKLTFRNEGLDVIAWPRQLRAARARVLTKDRTGSDHPGLLVWLVRR